MSQLPRHEDQSPAVRHLTSRLSPEQVRSLLSDPSAQVGGGPSMTTGKPHRVYRVTWDRCAVCKEREQGLAGIRAPGRFPKIVYVCEWCRKKLHDEILPEL